MKYVIVIGDGMADNPVAALGGKTPLEYADIPLMDALAKAGCSGSVRNVPVGVAPGSDTAILSIMGFDPRRFYTGRAPLEAAGVGVLPGRDDTAYRCNMVALEDGDMPYEQKKILSHSGGSIEGHESIELANALLADARFAALAKEHGLELHPSPSFRHIAVQKNARYTGNPLTPPHDHLGEVIGPLLPAGSGVAEGLRAMMALSNEILDNHPINVQRRAAGKLPANGIWFWAEGAGLDLPGFTEKYGKTGAAISAVPLVKGIAALAGLGSIDVAGATGELDTNYEGKAEAALAALAGGLDFVVLHVEAPDECTHNGDTQGKLQAIEWLDSRTIAPLKAGLDAAGEDYRLLILSDHKTLTSSRRHDADPVPFILFDSRKTQNTAVNAYTEAECAKGPLMEDGYRMIETLFADD